MRRRTTSRATPMASLSALAVRLGVGVRTNPRGIDDLDIPVAAAGERNGLRQVPHPLDGCIDLRGITHQEGKPSTGGRDVTDLDAWVATKLGRTESSIALQPLLQRVASIRFEQQMASTGEVEAQADVILREPLRPAAGERRSGNEARDRQQDPIATTIETSHTFHFGNSSISRSPASYSESALG